MKDHLFYMAQAIELAKKGLYTTDPNPRVGCVIVNEGQIVGSGWHQYAGQPHAEPNAIADAGQKTRGATAYVTLEPCSHFGKTPPCCDALISAGISQVVVAMRDPNPLVAGAGLKRLEDAGITVTCGVMEDEARDLNPGFIRRMETGLPFVCCKMAMSLDGRTAMQSGESKWITGPEARADVHKMRARSSAIVTGIATVLADNPSMTVRPEEFGLQADNLHGFQQPIRVIVDSNLSIPVDANILNEGAEVLIVTAVDVNSLTNAHLIEKVNELRKRASIIYLPSVLGDASSRVDLKGLIEYLGQLGCNEVMVEAGAKLSGAMLQEHLIDSYIIYMAPKLLGSLARPLFELPLENMSDQVQFEIQSITQVGKDWKIETIPVRTND